MVYYKQPEEVSFIRENCLLVCKTLAEVGKLIKPGAIARDLDRVAEEFIRSNDAIPGFKGLYGFPSTLCFSINECVVHGIPSDQVIKEGDIVSVDCGVYKNGFYGDAAYTFAVGEVEPEVMKLLYYTKLSLARAIEQAVEGNRLGDIGFAIQNLVEKELGYGVVRSLVGHGIGRELHEAPEVKNYGKRGKGMKLKAGLTIAIEPMVNLGTHKVKQLKDGWTIVTGDKKPSAHYEHTVLVGKKEADILSDHSYVEDAIKNNVNLTEISLEKSDICSPKI